MAKSPPPRRKHVPLRTCVACRQTSDKRHMTRIVRTPELAIKIDPTGKHNGRGAYLCDQPACWDKAVKKNLLNHALRTQLTDEDKALLLAYAQEHLPSG